MDDVTPRRLHSIKEAAFQLNVSVKTVRQEVDRGNLPFILVGKRRKIDGDDIEEYIANGRTLCRLENEVIPPITGTTFGPKVVGIEEARRRHPATKRA